MKAFLIMGLMILVFAATTSAQNKLTGEPRVKPAANPDQEEFVVNPHSDPYVIQSVGRTYNCRELIRMPIRDINSVANTVPGVQARIGESPIIGGAPGGTAYFVDGVRVYGSLPAITR